MPTWMDRAWEPTVGPRSQNGIGVFDHHGVLPAMDRPRIAAIVSGAAASTAAFFVVSRSSLLGTVTGAATISIIYAVVSYVSAVGIEGAGAWFKSRVSERSPSDQGQLDTEGRSESRSADGVETTLDAPASASKDDVVVSEKTEVVDDPGPTAYQRISGRRLLRPQWLLAASVLVALATSIYAAASPPAIETVEKLVLRTEVVEKTVTVTTVVDGVDPEQSQEEVLVATDGGDAGASEAGGGASDGATGGQTTDDATGATETPPTSATSDTTTDGAPATGTSEGDESSSGTSSDTTVPGETGQPEEPEEPGGPTEPTTPTTGFPGTDDGSREGDQQAQSPLSNSTP